ncbi:hypothetical protein Mangalitsa_004 [Escherichia phage Mangalitsa]|uniref:Uncharacterized protein n=1 Tax=Escherichia phage Mangalitsa TaxID=2589658 RepID=A0A5B9N5H3_9CAUD|nr:hypothetical protein HWC55_gp04 [Escherichia phage Mangalitsa]QEG07806.1 hypothetical protein Mangalitsa_004 [Escherichia phage Mangalitsa]
MDTVIKAACFKDLQDGQIFTVRSVKWIKVNESDKYNAVKFFDSSKACTFSDNIVVNIEVELTPEDEDIEVALRKTAGYNEGF